MVDLIKVDKEVKLWQIGEPATSGPQVMRGYWEDTKATYKKWLAFDRRCCTNGRGGYFRVVARKAEMGYE